MTNDLHSRVATRVRALREEHGLTQDELAQHLGFGSRQTVSDIENGKRRVDPSELALMAKLFDEDIDCFTDAFRLVGEGAYSFRARDVGSETLDAFQQKAGVWVATYRQLVSKTGQHSNRIGQKLELGPRSSFEDAQACGEALRVQWDLGDAPAQTLEAAIRRELHSLVLFVDTPAGISGAALRLSGLNAIFVNRQESVGRRSFDLAHELFHLLTWEAMPPARIESQDVSPHKGNRVEHLAENFAGALLMPRDVVLQEWENRGHVADYEWLNTTATKLRVTAIALKWRAVVVGLLTSAAAKGIDDQLLVGNGRIDDGDCGKPRLFSDDYVGHVHAAIESGRLSIRRASRLLDIRIGALDELFRSYGLDLYPSS